LFPPTQSGFASFGRERTALAARLAERQGEIEEAVLTRVFAVSEDGEPLDLSALDPSYLQGLRAAIGAAVAFGLEAIERGEERTSPPPPILLAQARLAARHNVGLGIVLRRYSAGYALLLDFLAEEAERAGLGPEQMRRLLRAQAVLDRLLAAIAQEYEREAPARPSSAEERRTERIERLLAGEPLDTSGIAYDFEACHLAILATGPGAEEALRDALAAIDANLLLVRPDGDTIWAWLGARCPPEPEGLKALLAPAWPKGCALAFGEPTQGLAGWRFSHRQARSALAVALRGQESVVRYTEVALLAGVIQDELLATSLRKLYLEPLEAERDGGDALRETLRAYFEAGRNVSSAAAALRVKRHTVANRLRLAEERIGCPLQRCGAEVEVALGLGRLDLPAWPAKMAVS
jgi:hypothetical protein